MYQIVSSTTASGLGERVSEILSQGASFELHGGLVINQVVLPHGAVKVIFAQVIISTAWNSGYKTRRNKNVS